MGSLMLFGLVACGGGGDATPTAAAAATVNVRGTLVQPQTVTASSSIVMARHADGDDVRVRALATSTCPDVPDGYEPLASVTVDFTDASGASLAKLTTDGCGAFTGTVPKAATVVKAAPAGGKPITQPISAFTASAGSVVSTLPGSATLVISVLQDLGNGQVALTVTDSLTGKAVLGLDTGNFSFTVNGSGVTANGVSYGASTSKSASLSVVLDASGSMDSTVGTTGKRAIQIASYATHALLDGLNSGIDEVGIVIFDSKVTPITDAQLATTTFRWGDGAGTAGAAYTVSASGLSNDVKKLRPIADLYNPYSKIYYSLRNSTTADAAHVDTGAVRLLSSYAWGGSTAFYSAVSSGLAQLAAGTHTRKLVVSMTDGVNNAGTKTEANVIAEAKAAGIPVYTIGFGSASAVNETSMSKIAQETGGEYKRVTGTDLTGLFQSIQTGIRFQYVSTFGTTLGSGATLRATVSALGETAARDLVIR